MITRPLFVKLTLDSLCAQRYNCSGRHVNTNIMICQLNGLPEKIEVVSNANFIISSIAMASCLPKNQINLCEKVELSI